MTEQIAHITDFINHCYGLLEQGNDNDAKKFIDNNIRHNNDILAIMKSYAHHVMMNEDYIMLSKIASILLTNDNESSSHWQYYAIANHSLNHHYSDDFTYFDLAIYYADDPFYAQNNKARAMRESGFIQQTEELYQELLQKYDDPEKKHTIKSSLVVLLAHHYPSREHEILPMAIEILHAEPDNTSIMIITAHIYLKQGLFAQAKPFYQQRFKAENFKQWDRPSPNIPEWQGEIIAGTTLYIWAEQGLGDEIKFLTLIEKLIKANMQLIIDCDHRILPMMQQRYPQITFYPRLIQQHHALDFHDIDYHAPMAQLFLESCADIIDLPAIQQPLLIPRKKFIDKWQKQLTPYIKQKNTQSALLIGISWYSIFGAPFDKGAKKASNEIIDHFRRNHALQDFAKMIQKAANANNPHQDIILINLQYEYDQQDINHYRHQQNSNKNLPHLLHFDDLNPTNDLEDVCGILHHCDYVVTIGNALAHLAGAMIKKTFTIIPENAAWHYSKHAEYHDYMAFYGRHQLVFFQDSDETQEQYRQRLHEPLSQFLNS